MADRVLKAIPENWEFETKDNNLIGFFAKMFDRLLTLEENTKISANLSNMEMLNKQKETNEARQAYVVTKDESICKICDRRLGLQMICVYPNGGVFHANCTKNPNECPITRQRFDQEYQVII